MFDPALMGDRTYLLGMVAIHVAFCVIFAGGFLISRNRLGASMMFATSGMMAVAAVLFSVLWLATFK